MVSSPTFRCEKRNEEKKKMKIKAMLYAASKDNYPLRLEKSIPACTKFINTLA